MACRCAFWRFRPKSPLQIDRIRPKYPNLGMIVQNISICEIFNTPSNRWAVRPFRVFQMLLCSTKKVKLLKKAMLFDMLDIFMAIRVKFNCARCGTLSLDGLFCYHNKTISKVGCSKAYATWFVFMIKGNIMHLINVMIITHYHVIWDNIPIKSLLTIIVMLGVVCRKCRRKDLNILFL